MTEATTTTASVVSTTTTTSPPTTTTTVLETTTTTQATTTTEPELAFSGIAGIKFGKEEDFTGSQITCYGPVGDDGQAYNLAIDPGTTGLDKAGLVTTDGEVVEGATSKDVIGFAYEDIETGEILIWPGDHVRITVERPPGGASQCDLPVLAVKTMSSPTEPSLRQSFM